MLQAHHVGVAIVGELRTQAVAGLARSAVADVVGQDDVVAVRIEHGPFAKHLVGEARIGEPSAGVARTVQDEHAVL
jgi:hypothetical protein